MSWRAFTRSNQCRFILPESREVVSVRYSQHTSGDDISLFFVYPTRPLWSLTNLNGRMESPEDAKKLLRGVYREFHLPCWMVVGDELIIWPPAIDDGDCIIVEFLDDESDKQEVGQEAV